MVFFGRKTTTIDEAKVRSTFATTRSLAEVVREAFARHRDDARAVVDCSEA
jgi:hypothetical protein